MDTRFIEATNGPQNWGKFMLGRFTHEEWERQSQIDDGRVLLTGRGWAPSHLLVVDLQTGEGAIFLPGGLASADLEKHRIWVCPLFEPFLTWLYEQDLNDLDALPAHIDLPAAPFELAGYRRAGPEIREEAAKIISPHAFALRGRLQPRQDRGPNRERALDKADRILALVDNLRVAR